MIKILVVEDEMAISDLICMNLSGAGYECTPAYDGRQASEMLGNNKYDLVLLDIMLPYIDGYELMEYICTIDTPAIFITAKASMNDKIKGLTSGADDYIVKPFEIVELLARVNIVLRRYHKLENRLVFKDIEINLDLHQVTKDGKFIELTNKEYELAVLFFRNIDIVLYRDKIYEEIWGEEYSWDSRTLDLHIQRLRKKLELKELLKTIYGIGYRLEKETNGELR